MHCVRKDPAASPGSEWLLWGCEGWGGETLQLPWGRGGARRRVSAGTPESLPFVFTCHSMSSEGRWDSG